MEKNYYEILEVDKNASSEIIKKAYNTLAKKYHPDLQPENLKAIYEEKFKSINEAYEILSIPEKRSAYDSSLLQNTISKEEYDAIYTENQKLKNLIQQIKTEYSQNNVSQKNNTYHNTSYATSNPNTKNIHSEYQKDYNEYMDILEKARKQAYRDAYIQDLKNRGYKIKYKKTFRDYFNSLIALVCTAFILLLLWQFPFIRNIFEKNLVFQTLSNMFSLK